MRWVAGMRSNKVYTVQKRPLDPRWSNEHLQMTLGWCIVGLHLGWDEDRAFQAAEALVMRSYNTGIIWPASQLIDDMAILEANCHEETA